MSAWIDTEHPIALSCNITAVSHLQLGLVVHQTVTTNVTCAHYGNGARQLYLISVTSLWLLYNSFLKEQIVCPDTYYF